jgi:predicted RNase H-like HicB family nuclease
LNSLPFFNNIFIIIIGGNKMSQFTLEFWEDEGWFVGRLVEVPGVFSQGETLEELQENIRDAYRMMLESEPANLVPSSSNKIVMELSF